MIIKIDTDTETLLNGLEELVTTETGLKPQSKSLVAQAVLKWAIKRLNSSQLRWIAPQMMTLAQQRKAVIADLKTKQQDMSPDQLRQTMEAIEKITKIRDQNSAPSVKKSTQV